MVDADPGSGNFRLNSVMQASANKIFIDDVDLDGTDIQPYLRTIDDSTSTIKGHVKITKLHDSSKFMLWVIDGANTESTGYFKIDLDTALSYSSTTPFSDGDDCILTFARTGDKGDTGSQGAQGAKGQKGEKGAQGAQGAQGAKGQKGQQGATGASGSSGTSGSAGSAGSSGNALSSRKAGS